MDSISFTQQHINPVKEQTSMPSTTGPLQGFGGGGPDMSGFGSSSINQTEASGFQNSAGAGVSAGLRSNSRQRQGDPFYLE